METSSGKPVWASTERALPFARQPEVEEAAMNRALIERSTDPIRFANPLLMNSILS
jgi:hypothetical protein